MLALYPSIRFLGFTSPCPSSSNTIKCTSLFCLFRFSTICSVSFRGTLGSFLPWITKSWAFILSALVIEEMLVRNSASLSGSPYSAILNILLQGPVFLRKVTKFAMPRTSTPAVHVSGLEYVHARTMNPPYEPPYTAIREGLLFPSSLIFLQQRVRPSQYPFCCKHHPDV